MDSNVIQMWCIGSFRKTFRSLSFCDWVVVIAGFDELDGVAEGHVEAEGRITTVGHERGHRPDGLTDVSRPR